MLTNTTEIGTATLPRRRLTIPAPTDVSPSAPRRPPRFPALAWAALALLGLLAHPSPAAAQTDVWTATLTPADFGSGLLGCNNASATSKCSTATVLSDDDFTYDSTDYSVTTLYLNATAFTFTVDTDITDRHQRPHRRCRQHLPRLRRRHPQTPPAPGPGSTRASPGLPAPPSASGSPTPLRPS